MRKLMLIAVITTSNAVAGFIGQWEGSGVDYAGNLLTWNSPLSGPTYALGMMRSLVTSAGHTVGADAPITPSNLATYDSLVVRMPRITPTPTELGWLSAWVNAGGLLFLIADRDMLGGSAPLNNILAGVNSSIHFESNSVDQNFALYSGLFLSDGPPYNIAGYYISPTPGRWITGGTALSHGSPAWTTQQQAQAEAIIHYQQIGLGYVIAFADTLDVDYFSPSITNPIGRMFLNAASYHNPGLDQEPPTNGVPEPSSLSLISLGWITAFGALLFRARR